MKQIELNIVTMLSRVPGKTRIQVWSNNGMKKLATTDNKHFHSIHNYSNREVEWNSGQLIGDSGYMLFRTLFFKELCALIKHMNVPSDHEKRSQQVADSTRRFLIGINTGGIALTTLFAGYMVDNGINPGWIVGPILTFTVGLVFVGVSLFLSKHRAINRSIVKENDQQKPDYKKWFWRSMSWDIFSAVFFLFAVFCCLTQISNINL